MFSVIAAYQFSFIWNIILILEKWLWLGLGAARVGMNKPPVIILMKDMSVQVLSQCMTYSGLLGACLIHDVL